jgi:hypothetical protein
VSRVIICEERMLGKSIIAIHTAILAKVIEAIAKIVLIILVENFSVVFANDFLLTIKIYSLGIPQQMWLLYHIQIRTRH